MQHERSSLALLLLPFLTYACAASGSAADPTALDTPSAEAGPPAPGAGTSDAQHPGASAPAGGDASSPPSTAPSGPPDGGRASDAAVAPADAAPAPDAAPANAPDAAPVIPPGEIYGVTLDTVDPLPDITAALAALPRKPTARIVFDEGQAPSAYANAVPAIHAVSHVMGEILDSQFMTSMTTAQYSQRTRDYLAAFPKDVDLWEVGNEINGNWLGPAPDVAAKMTSAYDLVKAAGGRTELTLYGCSDSGASYDMITWVKANVPPRMLTGLDVVLVSYYEGDCGSPRTDWASAFGDLRQLFPTAALGFGEVGAVDANGSSITDPAVAGPYLEKYYGMKITTPGYVGGYFWWYFAEDMVPKTKPMFSILSTAMNAMP